MFSSSFKQIQKQIFEIWPFRQELPKHRQGVSFNSLQLFLIASLNFLPISKCIKIVQQPESVVLSCHLYHIQNNTSLSINHFIKSICIYFMICQVNLWLKLFTNSNKSLSSKTAVQDVDLLNWQYFAPTLGRFLVPQN